MFMIRRLMVYFTSGNVETNFLNHAVYLISISIDLVTCTKSIELELCCLCSI